MDILKTINHAAHAVLSVPKAIVHEGEQVLDHFLPDSVTLTPRMPAYEKLPAAALAQAQARGQGQTYQQSLIQNGTGDKCEPVTLVVAGTKEELQKALEKQGWTKADKLSIWNGFKSDLSLLDKITGLSHIFNYNYKGSPMTLMHLHGKEQVMAFNKNNEHHEGRDHLRVFDSGKKDAQGRTIWEIAATRDTSIEIHLPSFGKGHHTDNNLDPERDLIMNDLLKSGVKNWKAVQGTMAPEDKAHVDSTYQTDGKVYVAEL